MGNQYSDASGGDLSSGDSPHGRSSAEGAGGGPQPPLPDGGGFPPPHQAAAVPLPVVGGGGGGGREIRDTGPLIGTPDAEDAAPIAIQAMSAPSTGDTSISKTGQVHTRTHSFDAGEMGALRPSRAASWARLPSLSCRWRRGDSRLQLLSPCDRVSVLA